MSYAVGQCTSYKVHIRAAMPSAPTSVKLLHRRVSQDVNTSPAVYVAGSP